MTTQEADAQIAEIAERRRQAQLKVARFEKRFEPSYRWLARYAALPLVLTPELVHYLRVQFLQAKRVPWVAEADLLLSDLCYPVGYEQYAMDSAIRDYLVSELQAQVGQETIESIARLLIRYIGYLAKSNPYLTPHDLQSQQWAAMVFIADQRVQAVQQIARAYRKSVEEVEEIGTVGLPSRAEMLRLSRITQELAPQIKGYEGLLAYAKLISQVLADPYTVVPEQLERSYDAGGVSLALPKALRRGIKTQPDLKFPGIPDLEDFEYVTPIVRFEDERENDIGLVSEPMTVEVATITVVSSISEDAAEEALEENLSEIEHRIIENFQEQDFNFQIDRSSEATWLQDIDESQISISYAEEPSVDILGTDLEEIEENVARFLLSVQIHFAVEVDYSSLDDYEDISDEDRLWAGQSVDGSVQVYLVFSGENLSEVEIDDVELDLDTPVWIDAPSRSTPVSAAPPQPQSPDTLEPFEIQIETIEKLEGEWFTLTDVGRAYRYIEPLEEGVDLEMVAIPAGEFLMGSPEDEPERYGDESPQHSVTISSFFMGRYPVTQAQWRVVAGFPKVKRDLEPNPSSFKGDNRPVEQVSWYEAVEFCARLSRHTGREYRLPSEAEWEYACRAGTTTPFHFGRMITTEVANYDGSAYADGPEGENREETTSVTEFGIANAFGLSDMHGNVFEWCLDHWYENYEGAPTDGSAWLSGDENASRVRRGGSWGSYPWSCRSAARLCNHPDDRYFNFGFRVVVAPRGLR